MMASLDELSLYKHNHVIQRYKKDFSKNTLSAEEAFKELMKYLWLSQKLDTDKKYDPTNKNINFSCVMHHEMSDIDDMWHTFLLFTKDYMTFCELHFGKYIHHKPFTEDDAIPLEEDFSSELTNYLHYINQNLGEETLLKWFGELV